MFHPNSVRVHVPEYRSVVSRRNFKPTEGYPDVLNYERKPDIVPILREEKDAPPVNVRIEKEEEVATFDGLETPSVSDIKPKHNMILRSHTRDVQKESVNTETAVEHAESTLTQEQETKFAEPASVVLPSGRDMQGYMPSRLAFYNRMEPIADGDYPFETFTHQAYCAMVYSNRMSVRQTLQEQNA